MAKNSITDYDNISGNNTDVQSVDISEGCSPSGINNAIREVMADLADVNDGTVALTSPQVNSLTLNGNATFGDNDKAIFGAGSDLQIYHDGSNSKIADVGTGDLQLSGQNVGIYSNGGEPMFLGIANGKSELYYDNSKKLETTSTGIDVTGGLNTTGNLGIGTSSPSATHRLTLDSSSNYGGIQLKQSGTQIGQIIQEGGTGNIYIDADSAGSGGSLILRTNSGSEAMRVDSSQNVLVGTTTASPAALPQAANIATVAVSGKTGINVATVGAGTFIRFGNTGYGQTGTISTSGSTTAYNTSSDYRLKENVTDITSATDRLKQLNPVRFNFIGDADTTVDGFLAHEVQGIVPEAITGTKDGMRDEEYEVTPAVLDDDGNEVTPAVMGTRSVPEYQGIDQSKLVPLLVATIQELEARIATLEAN